MCFTFVIFFVSATCVMSQENTIHTDLNEKLFSGSVRGVTNNSIKKCCELKQVYDARNINCTDSTKEFNPAVYSITNDTNSDLIMLDGFSAMEQFNVKIKLEDCRQLSGSYIPLQSKRHKVKLLKDGNLYVGIGNSSSTIYSPDQYCIDNFDWGNNRTEINALLCIDVSSPDHHYRLSSTCMLISCFFIVLTVAVYAWLPELRNLQGMVIVAYLLCFLVGFTFMATMQILLINNNISETICTSFTFIIYFSILSAFFWQNVLCYDLWCRFRLKRSISERSYVARKRFLLYSLYAFGVPLLLTMLLVGLEFGLGSNRSPLSPNIRLQGCFLSGKSKLLYLYVPIVVLCVTNLICFILMVIEISQIRKQSQNALQKKNKRSFWLYIKLFLVTGVNWILEVISSFYPQADNIWKFTDAYNVLVGLLIFIIFVCNVNTLKMIRNRYRQHMGLTPLARSQTAKSSVSTPTCPHSNEEAGKLCATDKD